MVNEYLNFEIDCRNCKNLEDNKCIKYDKNSDDAIYICTDIGFKDYEPITDIPINKSE